MQGVSATGKVNKVLFYESGGFFILGVEYAGFIAPRASPSHRLRHSARIPSAQRGPWCRSVGSAPRAMKFTSDGTKLIVVNSGFIRPSDPSWGLSKGSVTVISIPAKGIATLTQNHVSTVDLTKCGHTPLSTRFLTTLAQYPGRRYDGNAVAVAQQLNTSLSFSDEVYPTSLT